MQLELGKIREEIIILLIGIKEEPIPSRFHLQKELFILSKVVPKLQEVLVFDEHYQGAYSVEVQDLLRDNLFHYKDAIEERNGRIYLTNKGRQDYKEIYERYSSDNKFIKLLKIMKLIREMYDKLSREELALLLYTKYPHTAQASSLIDIIKDRKKEIIEGLRKKGYITKERYEELLSK